jgi:RNA polymerase sigma-54 factor
MAISQRLQARLSQKLVLTPSLQQAIKLLPMSTLELADLLTQEVVENPLLEETPTDELRATDAQTAADREEPEATPPERKDDTWNDADYEYFRWKCASCRPSRTPCRPRHR